MEMEIGHVNPVFFYLLNFSLHLSLFDINVFYFISPCMLFYFTVCFILFHSAINLLFSS